MRAIRHSKTAGGPLGLPTLCSHCWTVRKFKWKALADCIWLISKASRICLIRWLQHPHDYTYITHRLRLQSTTRRGPDEQTGMSPLRVGARGGYPDRMVDEVKLSSLRGGRFLLRACCTRQEVCGFSWEIEFDEAMRVLGDISLAELRAQLRCRQCDAPITTTLISPK